MKYLSLLFLLLPTIILGQDPPPPENALSKLGPNPLMIIDSTKVQQSDLMKYDANSIAAVTVLVDTSAQKIYGSEAKDGAVIIETRKFARKKFIEFFRQASMKYDSLYKVAGNDSTFQYILNDKLQKDNFEGNLSMIDKDLFIDIELLNSDQLQDKYGITEKLYGILIRAKKPKDLFKADEKF